jgi:peptidoglycan/xylan/chitin deacetylase (PgdA/CDA1 family)
MHRRDFIKKDVPAAIIPGFSIVYKRLFVLLVILSAFYTVLVVGAQAQTLGSAANPEPPRMPPYHLYLTFDDGPLLGSERIDDAVKAEKIKINVFVIGAHVQASQRMRAYYQLYESNPFIEIGNHGYSHANEAYHLYYEQPEKVYLDFLSNERILQLKNRLARLPGRNMWRLKGKSLNDIKFGSLSADLLFENGFSVFGWDLEWEHDKTSGIPVQNAGDMVELIEKLMKGRKTVTENHLVLLCHDEMFRKKWEETELRELIRRLRATGLFEFNHLSEYPH